MNTKTVLRPCRARPGALANRVDGRDRLITPALIVADLSYLVGVTAPMMSIERFVVFSETFSLLSGTVQLFESGEVLLGVIVVAFSLIFPVWKLWTLHRVWRRVAAHNLQGDRRLGILVQLGRWSMLDVFLVAVIAAVVKLGGLVEVHVHGGLYFFALSVIITMFLGHRISNLAGRVAAERAASVPC